MTTTDIDGEDEYYLWWYRKWWVVMSNQDNTIKVYDTEIEKKYAKNLKGPTKDDS